jgi:serine/threonine protein kinase
MSKASDVYSFGLVAWYFFVGGHDPFDGMDDEDICLLKLVEDKVLAKAFEACSDPIRQSILDVCLCHNPNHRSCEIVSKVREALIGGSQEVSLFSHNLMRLISEFLIRKSMRLVPYTRFLSFIYWGSWTSLP